MVSSSVMKRIGLLGAGTVGTALAQLLEHHSDKAQISKALVRDMSKERTGIEASVLTTNASEALDADILVELMGGTTRAGDLLLEFLAQGKPVVTANKAVLAERWNEFLPYLQRGLVHFEAAIMAGTPVVGPLTNVLRGSQPIELHAILNGTCNYILSELEKGEQYPKALAEAQRLGYAEADPSLDVGGYDAAHKLTVLARLVFDPDLSWETVHVNTTGIESLTPEKMRGAVDVGGHIRLLGSVFPQNGDWQIKVRPVFLPDSHPMAGSASNRNALYFRGDAVGEVLITGAGAGGMPTASGVLGDVLNALANRPGPALLPKAVSVAEQSVSVLEEVQ